MNMKGLCAEKKSAKTERYTTVGPIPERMLYSTSCAEAILSESFDCLGIVKVMLPGVRK